MLDKENITPFDSLSGLDLKELSANMNELKQELNEIKKDEDYKGELDIWLQAIENLEEELVGVKDFAKLPLKKKALVFSYIVSITVFAEELTNSDEDDFDLFDEDTEFDEDEDEDDEDEKEIFPKKK